MMQRAEDATNNFPPPADQRGELTQAEIDAAYAAGGDAEVQRLKDAHALTQPNAFMDMIIKEGGQLLLDVLGVTDIMNCVTKGDFGACVMSIIGFAPWGKVAKLLGSIPLIAKIASKVIGFADRVKDAFSLLRKNDNRVGDLIRGQCLDGDSCNLTKGLDNTNPGLKVPPARAHEIGVWAERNAGIPPGMTNKIESLNGTAHYRKPDILIDATSPGGLPLSSIADVKNVRHLKVTEQLKDYMAYAASKASKKPADEAPDKVSEFGLIIRKTTSLDEDLVKMLCKPPTHVKVFVKYLPDENGEPLSENMISKICPK